MWTLRRDNDYGTQPRDVTWYKIGKFCVVPAVFTATQTASRVRAIAGLPYPAKDYTCVPISYVPVSGTASLMGTYDCNPNVDMGCCCLISLTVSNDMRNNPACGYCVELHFGIVPAAAPAHGGCHHRARVVVADALRRLAHRHTVI